MIEPRIITNCHRIAKSLAPLKSGNLRENAIKITHRRSNGFKINYSYVNAYYIQYVEEGTHDIQGKWVIKPRRFIKKTAEMVADYLEAYYNSGKNRYGKKINNALNDYNKGLYATSRDYRELVHEKSYETVYKRFMKE